ncbi:hypothetical protein ISP17_13635 [Dyella ginsengisoli]|uniref:Uncharacterized protein n=1 Tax=Dyella ginsengisoli TaxID=363848 RepID=A0ABW8JV17_9GAMM
MTAAILLALLAMAVLYIARLRARLKARGAAAAQYDAAVLAFQARQRWEDDVRRATGVIHTTKGGTL